MKKLSEEERIHTREKTRQRYANDPAFRAQCIQSAKEYRANNPQARLGNLLKKYGVTLEEYQILAEEGCAICGRKDNAELTRNQRFHVDHCHVTGQFRGLLCASCNFGLGKFSDNLGLLEQAAAYLELHSTKT